MNVQNQIEELYIELTGIRSRLQTLKSGIEGQWVDSMENTLKHIKLAQNSMEDIK